jgi:hypothetical protein
MRPYAPPLYGNSERLPVQAYRLAKQLSIAHCVTILFFGEQVRLYEVLSDNVRKLLTAERPEIPSDQLRLVVPRRVSTHRHGWEVFKIGDIVRRWVNDSTTNYGQY